jgi:putative hydrolase of the HAD superfamily
MSAPVTAVTFDFWNTIARVPAETMSELRSRAVVEACAECGVEVETERLAAILADVARSYESSWQAGDHFHPREGAALLVARLGLEEAAAELVAEAFLHAGRDADLELSPHVAATLATLDDRGVRIGIVCDVGFTGGELLRGFLEREEVLRHFDGWAFSDEVGHYKPAAPIFEAALASLGATPAEAMHVGDLRRTDVAGAAALGMRTVRYRALHDDPGAAGEPEAEFVLDSHADLPDLLERLG